MSDRNVPRPVVLCILDGWGERADKADNAILDADTPHWHEFLKTSPHAQLQASEHYVGLPDGQMGNSEVGHMNLGAGRVVTQDLPRIDKAVADGSIVKTQALQEFIARLTKSHGTAHLMGLVSPGGVHSHQDHIAALGKALSAASVPVAIHAFLDGRDTPPKSAEGYVAKLMSDVAGGENLRLATISGRYYAMDRDKRWDRVGKAYDALVDAKGERAPDAKAAIARSYGAGKTDEFVLPTIIGDYAGMKDGDGVICANFRADRVREILTALVDPDFKDFPRSRVVRFAAAAGMAEYSERLGHLLLTLFPPQDLSDTFGEVVSQAGLKQLRIAETEKYAHVTFFF
ncbi:MAG TPA: 2,3-bisphosphoglycerate-independent phosphoglycerate mutase, partial [Stellaceae bacterium]|nr:2,3-bisphosphoglycerate-independent phosphoglycerate mutase [Stellaceae bacterium]